MNSKYSQLLFVSIWIYMELVFGGRKEGERESGGKGYIFKWILKPWISFFPLSLIFRSLSLSLADSAKFVTMLFSVSNNNLRGLIVKSSAKNVSREMWSVEDGPHLIDSLVLLQHYVLLLPFPFPSSLNISLKWLMNYSNEFRFTIFKILIHF